LRNKEKSGPSFFEICVITEQKVVFQSSQVYALTKGGHFSTHKSNSYLENNLLYPGKGGFDLILRWKE
jgi:hypothetical protein